MNVGVTIALVGAVAYLISWAVAELVRRNAARLSLIQTPNDRSSHVVPTPSGGGIGIAIVGTLAGFALALGADGSLLVAVGVGAVAATIGLLDDRYDLSSRLRLFAQGLMVVALLVALRDVPPIMLWFGPLPDFLFYGLLAMAGLWWFNLFNFMDGIDGIAGAEAIFVLVGALALIVLTNAQFLEQRTFWWIVSIIGACTGFLRHNWPPAKIFMGDAGSNYLAVTIFAVALMSLANGLLGYPTWAILVASFVADATVTLIGRALARQRWFAAHRLHAYQKLSQRWGGHGKVTMLSVAINLVWLYPLAYWAQMQPDAAWWAAAIAYFPLVVLCVLAGAGRVHKSITGSPS